MSEKTNCETCIHYVYDEEYDCYECEAYFDEDEIVRMMADSFSNCPYYQLNDEYKIVRKQI